MSYCIYNGCDTIINTTKGHFGKVIIHTDYKKIQAQEINILTTAWPLFALHYLGLSSDSTEVFPVPQNPQYVKLLEYMPP